MFISVVCLPSGVVKGRGAEPFTIYLSLQLDNVSQQIRNSSWCNRVSVGVVEFFMAFYFLLLTN